MFFIAFLLILCINKLASYVMTNALHNFYVLLFD